MAEWLTCTISSPWPSGDTSQSPRVGEWILRTRLAVGEPTRKVKVMSARKRYGVQNRPSDRVIQVGLLLVIAVPAVVAGTVGFLAGQILTVNWPTGGDR